MGNLQVTTDLVYYSESLREDFDLGLRKMIGIDPPYLLSSFSEIDPQFCQKRIMYFIQDAFNCFYILLPLQEDEERCLLAGPYIGGRPEIDDVMRIMKRNEVPGSLLQPLMQYYGTLPCFQDEGILEVWFKELSHRLCDAKIEIRYIRLAHDSVPSHEQKYRQLSPHEFTSLEERYLFEKLLIEKIAAADQSAAEEAFRRLNMASFDARSSDSVHSNQYCLAVFNALCRKAAEKGGVHPNYLDELSRSVSLRILSTCSLESLRILRQGMIGEYCDLVRKYGFKSESVLISRAITYISANLAATGLSLDSAAAFLNVSKGYLSAKFKKETGRSVTEYIADRRIDAAKEYLRTTTLPIQDVADLCGIDDAAYFSRPFKKKTDLTPVQYRRSKKGSNSPR